MHRIYTSLALVIDSKPFGEADRMVVLYTREFGLISAIAKGLRHEKSKLRYALGVASLIEVSLVKGKEVWRLTSAQHIKSYPTDPNILKAGLLLKRLLGEEITDAFLFDSLKNYFEFVETQPEETVSNDAEIYIALQILERLGYIQESVSFSQTLGKPFSVENSKVISGRRVEAVSLINQALTHTQL